METDDSSMLRVRFEGNIVRLVVAFGCADKSYQIDSFSLSARNRVDMLILRSISRQVR